MKASTTHDEKIIVITGATSGLGKEVIKELAKMNATIVAIARNKELSAKVKDEIVNSSGNNKIEFIYGDLSSLKSIKQAAEEIKKRYPKINVLINNAGIFHKKRTLTEDGFESTFGVDYLAHFYLTLLLIDNLKECAPSRIINIASDIHLFFGLKINNLQLEKNYRSHKAYGNAKAALVLFTNHLHKLLEGTSVTANAFHPGHFTSKMTKENLPKILTKLPRRVKTPEEAARALAYLATSDELTNVSGKYFRQLKIGKSSKQSYDIGLQQKLWNKSLDMIEEKIKGFKSPF